MTNWEAIQAIFAARSSENFQTKLRKQVMPINAQMAYALQQ